MPSEIIGEFGAPVASCEWISAQATLAIQHIIKACGPPPPEMALQVEWQEHELDSYPLIVLVWENGMRGTPAKYLNECQDALFEFEYGEPPPRYPCWWEEERDKD
jgi:hypothetical protein